MMIEQKLKEIICALSNNSIEANQINENTVLTDDLGFDSIKIIEMIIKIENIFNIEIRDEDYELEMIVYGNLYQIIKNNIEELS